MGLKYTSDVENEEGVTIEDPCKRPEAGYHLRFEVIEIVRGNKREESVEQLQQDMWPGSLVEEKSGAWKRETCRWKEEKSRDVKEAASLAR